MLIYNAKKIKIEEEAQRKEEQEKAIWHYFWKFKIKNKKNKKI